MCDVPFHALGQQRPFLGDLSLERSLLKTADSTLRSVIGGTTDQVWAASVGPGLANSRHSGMARSSSPMRRAYLRARNHHRRREQMTRRVGTPKIMHFHRGALDWGHDPIAASAQQV